MGNYSVFYSTESHFASTLESMGHQVVRLQEGQTTTGFLVNQACSANLFVWVHTHGIKTQGNVSMADVLEALRRRGIPAISYHLDAFCGISSRWATYQHDEYIVGGLSHFFTVDQALADWLTEHTQTRGIYLPAGVLGAECTLAVPTDPFDVCFVGSYRYHRDWDYRPKLIDWLERTYRDRFRLYGQDGGRVVRGAELNQVYADARVVVGDSFLLPYPYFSDRVFETLGRGGMLIHPRSPGMEAIFKDREHLVFYDYGDFVHLKELIDYYLEHDDEREEIRVAGHEFVKASHTYDQRWQTILKEVLPR